MSLTTCDVNLCLAQRQSVARPNWTLVFMAGFFKSSGMEKLADERIVEPRLPLLYEGEFKAAIVGTTNKKRDWGPNIEVLMFTPESEGQFSMNQLVVAELKVFSGSAVLSIQSMMHGRPNLKFGLHVQDMDEANIHTVGKEEFLRKEIV